MTAFPTDLSAGALYFDKDAWEAWRWDGTSWEREPLMDLSLFRVVLSLITSGELKL